MRVVYGCCVGSNEKLERYVTPRVPRRSLIAVFGATSIAAAYNGILNEVLAQQHVCDMLVLLHDDLELTDPRAEPKLLAALDDPRVAVVGVAGARNCRSLAWWEYDTVGHQRTDTCLIDFGQRSGVVDALEGSVLALSAWAIQQLRFDERYDDFHGYDCDIARAAVTAGMHAVVADVDTHHHTRPGFKSAASAAAWARADQLFRKKWGYG